MDRLPPDGYAWVDGGPGIVLVDPEWCPAGHPMELHQRGYAPCAEHKGHPQWTCRCGQVIYRGGGEFVDVLECR
jgi:hypothetical protein